MVMIKIHATTLHFPYGCIKRFLALREEHKLQIFGNKIRKYMALQRMMSNGVVLD
jgi:hypothetical protein